MDTATDIGENRIEVYDKYANPLFRLAYSMVLSSHDAEDIVHDVYAKYFTKLPHFRDEEHEKAWFLRVTVNQCHDFARKQKHRTYTPLEEVITMADTKEDLGVLPAIFALDEKYKVVLLLHYFEGYSVEEIALALKLSVSAIKMRLSRGREQLKLQIGKENPYVS